MSASDTVRKNVYFKSSESMNEVEAKAVQAVITSPPYWNLKNYDHTGQIGHGESYEKYHQRLNNVWEECKRVLNSSGTLWIVIDKIIYNSQLLNIPYDIARNCKRIGFFLKDIIIWNKPTSIAGMNKSNLVNKYEYVLVFSKSLDHYRIKHVIKNGLIKTPDITPDMARLTNLWRFPVKAGSIRRTPEHESHFPEELVKRIIQISTEPNDLILDPFLGSGTTMKAALEIERLCKGYEINEHFANMIIHRIGALGSRFFDSKLSKWNI